MVALRGLDEIIDMFGFDVDMYQSDMHDILLNRCLTLPLQGVIRGNGNTRGSVLPQWPSRRAP
jgi:hypothetical protein